MFKCQYTYNQAIKEYIDTFERKQGLVFHDWIERNVVADFGGTTIINMDNIRYDIDTNQPPGRIDEWIDHCLELYAKNNELYSIAGYPAYCEMVNETIKKT